MEGTSNRLLGLTQTVTRTNAGRTRSVVTTPVAYRLDANGSMTSDGLRDFEYDASGRLARVRVFKDGEAAQVKYLHNALGQRVLKSEPQAEQTLPSEQELGTDFITWLRRQFGWMFTQAQANTSIGTAYVFGDGQIPPWALLGEYDNGSSTGAGRTEYLWLPTEDGNAIPIGMYRGGRFFAIHSDHLGTPRLVTNEQNKPVWQWPYSAFGNNKPTGVLKATPNPRAAITNQPVLLKATGVTEMNLRFPGQYFDQEAGTMYNYFRDYDAGQGRYRQADPIGLDGGVNRFAYVEGNALSYTDPTGLVKLHGNWCGPNWTGGFATSYDKLTQAEKAAALPPVTQLDACCQTHDLTYAVCRQTHPCDAQARQQCFEQADRALSACAATSGSSYGANLLLFGNPRTRILEYMRAIPAPCRE